MSNLKEMQAQLAMMAAAIAAMQPEEETSTPAPAKKPRGKATKAPKEETPQAPLPTANPDKLYKLREEAAQGGAEYQGKTQRYADGIAAMLKDLAKSRGETALFNAGFAYWGEIPLSGEIPERLIPYAKAINEEKKAGQAMAKSRGHTNPSEWWKQIRAKGMRPSEGGRNVKAIDEVLKPELEKLYKRAWQNQSELGKEYRPLFEGLAALLKANGVVLATLHKKADTRFKKK